MEKGGRAGGREEGGGIFFWWYSCSHCQASYDAGIFDSWIPIFFTWNGLFTKKVNRAVFPALLVPSGFQRLRHLNLEQKILASLSHPSSLKQLFYAAYLSSSGPLCDANTGEFDHDMIHGEGLWSWPDGSSFAGQAKHGRREGKGLFVTAMRVSLRPQELYYLWQSKKTSMFKCNCPLVLNSIGIVLARFSIIGIARRGKLLLRTKDNAHNLAEYLLGSGALLVHFFESPVKKYPFYRYVCTMEME